MRLMYTLLLQYDKSKYVDFDVFPFWFVATYKTEFEKHQPEWERANEKKKQTKVPVDCYTQECSSLSSWADRINAEQCILLLSSVHRFGVFCCCYLILVFLFNASSRGEDECQKQKQIRNNTARGWFVRVCICAPARTIRSTVAVSTSQNMTIAKMQRKIYICTHSALIDVKSV